MASSVWKVEETKSDVTLPEGVRMYERNTKHENTINYMVTFKSEAGTPKEVCTTDPNGGVHFWTV